MITPDIQKKLEEIGFKPDEINTLSMIHELSTRQYPFDIKKLIHQIAAENLSKEIARRFEEKQWSEEDFFEIVEKHRGQKKT